MMRQEHVGSRIRGGMHGLDRRIERDRDAAHEVGRIAHRDARPIPFLGVLGRIARQKRLLQRAHRQGIALLRKRARVPLRQSVFDDDRHLSCLAFYSRGMRRRSPSAVGTVTWR